MTDDLSNARESSASHHCLELRHTTLRLAVGETLIVLTLSLKVEEDCSRMTVSPTASSARTARASAFLSRSRATCEYDRKQAC